MDLGSPGYGARDSPLRLSAIEVCLSQGRVSVLLVNNVNRASAWRELHLGSTSTVAAVSNSPCSRNPRLSYVWPRHQMVVTYLNGL